MNDAFIQDITSTINKLVQSLQILSQEIQKQTLVTKQLENERLEISKKSDDLLKREANLEEKYQLIISEKSYIETKGLENQKAGENVVRQNITLEDKIKGLEEREKEVITKEEQVIVKLNDLEKKNKELAVLEAKERDLVKREKVLEREIVIDRDRKELLQAREKTIQQKEKKLQRLMTA